MKLFTSEQKRFEIHTFIAGTGEKNYAVYDSKRGTYLFNNEDQQLTFEGAKEFADQLNLESAFKPTALLHAKAIG